MGFSCILWDWGWGVGSGCLVGSLRGGEGMLSYSSGTRDGKVVEIDIDFDLVVRESLRF